jgi:hypothetical protein
MGEINYTTGIVLAILFSMSIIIFATNFASDNSSQVTLDEDFNDAYNSFEGNMTSLDDAVDSASDSFNQDNVKEGTDTATSGGQFKATGPSIVASAKTAISLPFKKIFGEDPAFGFLFGALITMIILIWVRYAYKTWFGKDPD